MDCRKTKVLLIGHNVLDSRTNMGKTLSSFFTGWAPERLAQIYFHSEVPTMDICHCYYRVTDTDALKSIIPWRRKPAGRAFSAIDIDLKRSSSRVDTGIKRKIYSFGRKRTSFIYSARNTVWRLSHWYSDELKRWISEFHPDVIFFAAGDYAFAYDIAYTISEDFHIPLIMYCCDDYFINRRNPGSLLGILVHKSLMESVYRSMSRTVAVITICDKMTEAYQRLFDTPIYTVYTGCSAKNAPNVDGEGMVYLGNLGGDRHSALVDIGQALNRISEKTGERLYLHVYSAENRPEVLRELKEENGIQFHGSVNSEDVKRIIAGCRLAVHAESFKAENRRNVMYSVSTKIADLLASGRCIFAYGPGEVASMEYLAKNQAACVVNDPQMLEKELEDILNNRERRNAAVEAAMVLAERNHNSESVRCKVAEIIYCSCEKVKTIVHV